MKPKPKELQIDLQPVKNDPLQRVGGSEYPVWNQALVDRTRSTARTRKGEGIDEHAEMTAAATMTIVALEAFKPTDPVEAMIASQAVALHYAAMECLRKAMVPEQPFEFASKMRKEAASLSRAMVEVCEALDRRRGKGPQVMRIERVVVNEGGQAIVGNVGAPASLPSSGVSQMPIVDHMAEPRGVGSK